MWVILRVAVPAVGRAAGAAVGKVKKSVLKLVKKGTEEYNKWMKQEGTEVVGESPNREAALKRMPRPPGRSPGALGGKSRGRSPGAFGGRIKPGKGTLPPRNKGGVIRSTTKRDSKKPITRRRKK